MSRCYGIFVYTMSKRFTTEEFIKKAREIHGDKYDYSKVKYLNTKTKICIICPVHGEFWQTPNSHLRKRGCPKCGDEQMKDKQRLSIYEFIEKAKKIHHNRYDYSKTEYINDKTKVCIICPEHGEFWQTPNNHLKGKGCPSCYGNKKMTKEDFIKKAKETHENRYDYSKVEYINTDIKVLISCPEHGEFWQTPYKHINCHQGCPKCGGHLTISKDEFIKKSIEIHGDKYDYSKVEYTTAFTKVCITCPKHGEFWQTPIKHYTGQGCPKCKGSKLEEICCVYLDKHNVKYLYRSKPKWLRGLELDIFIPEYNIAIECQGEQHFFPVDFGYNDENLTKKKFKELQERDLLKYKLCEDNNVKLHYIKYDDKNIEELLNKILCI